MSDVLPTGRFTLNRGIRLIQTPGGGVILQSDPLRAIRINPSAFAILKKCRTGLQVDGHQHRNCQPGTMFFLDTLCQGGILDWTPSPPRNLPLVSIVIPVYNRPKEIETCLASLQSLEYPAGKIETIVVDDASLDHTPAVARRFNVRLIVMPRNRGQSAARNTGVAAAKGEIIAFLDSDCIAQPNWLRELVPYFQDPRVALVGGDVGAYYRDNRMDRYEQVCSALNMGADPVMGRGNNCVCYVPTCNMLVRKEVYDQMGGLDENLRVGEDVDLCWRLMADNHHLRYIPVGRVLHKHRNRFLHGFLRRFEYGTSESLLYARFPKVAKHFPWQPAGIGIMLAVSAALATRSWLWMALTALILALETGYKRYHLMGKTGVRLPLAHVLRAVTKSHFQLAYYLAFYLIRYHLLLFIVLSFAWTSMIWLWLTVIFFPVLVAYFNKKPRLSFPVFAFFYLAEHAFYQSGAFWGCLRQKSFRLYGISFKPVGFRGASSRSAQSRSMAMSYLSKKGC
jgi:mycofactocin system glycosyltransferase